MFSVFSRNIFDNARSDTFFTGILIIIITLIGDNHNTLAFSQKRNQRFFHNAIIAQVALAEFIIRQDNCIRPA